MRISTIVLAAGMGVAAAATGCGDDSGGGGGSDGAGGSTSATSGATGATTSATGPGATTAGVGSSSAGGGTPVCNELDNDAPAVPEDPGAGQPPERTGGAIVDGTYFVTERLDFSGETCGCNSQVMLVISEGGTHLEAVSRTDSETDTHSSADLSVSGATLTMAFTCPSAGSADFEYSVTDSALILFANQQYETYTRQ